MRRLLYAALPVLAACFLFTSCNNETTTASVDLNTVKPEIQAMEDAFAAAEKEKNADKVVEYYADNAMSYGSNRQPDANKAAIRERIANRLASDTSGHYNVYKVVDLFGEGNMLVEVGSWTEMDASGTKVDEGHYMSYFQKIDGKYKCVRDMSVSSNAPKQQ